MIKLNKEDKRWLEIIFYLLCNRIYSINNRVTDIVNFISGYRWTNMFDYDTLIKVVEQEKILLNSYIIPSKREFIVAMNENNCRLRMDKKSIRELIKDTNYTYWRRDVFKTQMKEEINKTEIFPKIDIPRVHEAIYSFLLALRYIGDLVKKIKF